MANKINQEIFEFLKTLASALVLSCTDYGKVILAGISRHQKKQTLIFNEHNSQTKDQSFEYFTFSCMDRSHNNFIAKFMENQRGRFFYLIA